MKQVMGGYCQVSVREIKFPGGDETPGVEGLPKGDKTSEVTPKGNRVPGGDRPVRGGENSPATKKIKIA